MAASTPAWRESFARSLAGGPTVYGHGDLGPWNVLARDGDPVAIIDWDDAGPMGHVWDLANVVWLNAHLHDDDVAAPHGLPSAEGRMRQSRLILDGYRLAARERIGFVERMIEFAVRSACEEAVVCGVGPTTQSPAQDGFPTLWAVDDQHPACYTGSQARPARAAAEPAERTRCAGGVLRSCHQSRSG